MQPSFPEVTFAKWRELVEKGLAGKPFDKALVHEAIAGIPIAPLYTAAPSLDASARRVRSEPFRICMRHVTDARVEDLVADVADGADALWLPLDLHSEIAREELARTTFVLEASEVPRPEIVTAITPRAILAVDPMAWRARGHAPFATLQKDLGALGQLAVAMRDSGHRAAVACVSTEPYHDAGADAADEIAIALSTGAAYLEAFIEAGLTPDEASSAIALRVPVGRDTFVQMCKLRALRVCFTKMLVASGVTSEAPTLVHAVCSEQTLTVRDPWVNMLRVTTQVFAAVIGGADLVTPTAFDEATGAATVFSRRVARNTGLVLREESALGKVSDPAVGSYYFDTLTDTLARQAWVRFQDLCKNGGITEQLESGELRRRLEAKWEKRLDQIAKRKLPILGVSEFAFLEEKLPYTVPPMTEQTPEKGALPIHRDASLFEALRSRAEALTPKPEILLLTLGSFASSRARAGFAANFFAAGGILSREVSSVEPAEAAEPATVVCLCGTDERYAEEAAARASELKARGVPCVLLAGRPGALEADLRKAGVDGFIFVGCDVFVMLVEIFGRFTATTRNEATR
ncbi:MAG: methylmalonyl-CoA mutase family protein [Polyangiaceae bacterium]|nr:methylmalonyl-CoA mutase family protein [Polyangiaceae bacterium]